MGGFILFLLFIGLVVAAVLAIRKAVNDERERKQREEEDRRQQALAEAARRKQQEDEDNSRRRYEEALRRHKESEERTERERKKRLVARAEHIVRATIAALEQLLKAANQAVSGYESAAVEYERVKFYPFWHAAYKAYEGINNAEIQLRVIGNKQTEYYQIATEIPGELPPFINLEGIETTYGIVRAVHPKLDTVVYAAHGKPDFAAAYGALLIEKAIKDMLSTLSDRLDGIESAIRQSTVVIAASLQQTNRQLAAIQSEIAWSNEEEAERHRSMISDINRGMLVATASANSNALTAQKQARTTISELRNIKRRL